jgi:WD40 repeat protein
MKIFHPFILPALVFLSVCKAGAQPAELNIHSGHSAWIKDFSISRDEKFLATASYDYTVKLWDFRSGKELRTFRGHKDYVSSVKFSPNGKLIASGDITGTIMIWDIESGNLIRKLTPHHTREVTSIEFSADNNRIVTTSRDQILLVLDIDHDKEIRAFNLEATGIKACFMPDNNIIASLDNKGYLYMWDVRGDSSLKGVHYYQGRITDFAVTRDGSAFVTTVQSDTSNVRIMDIAGWTTRRWLKGHEVYPAAVTATDNDSLVFTASFRKQITKPATYSVEIKKWNIVTGECLDSVIVGRESLYDYSLEFAGRSGQLACMLGTTRLGIFNAKPLSSARIIRGGGTLINAVFETSAGHFIMAADDGPLKTLVMENNEYRVSGPGLQNGAIRQALLSKDRKHLFALAFTDSSIYRISLSNNEPIKVAGGNFHIREFFINREQDHLVYRAMMDDSLGNLINSSELIVQNLKTGRVTARHHIASFMIIPYGLLQDNSSVVYQRLNDSISIWDSKNNKTKYLTDPEFRGSPATRFVPIGRELLMVVTQTGKLQCWNWITGKLLRTVDAHPGNWIFNIIISPSEEFILTCSDDKTMRLWRASDLELLKTFTGHESWVAQGGFLSNGKQVFSASGDYTLRIWDMATGEETASLIMVDTADLITRLPNNYYTATRQATRFLSYRIGNELYPFEQFDLKYNRPHEVLRALGTRDTALINAYEQAYTKRLKRSGFSDADFNNDLHLPDVIILRSENIPQVTSVTDLEFEFRASDEKYFLDRYYVSVNNVPVNGVNGKSLKSLRTKLFHGKEKIRLSSGTNKIVISCMNEKGVESLRKEIYIRHNPGTLKKDKVYFVGIGVSRFSDSRMDLQYADKDIRDLVKVFQSRYPEMEIDTFLNKAVTREQVLRVKQKLLKTGVDDIVVISVSSHGLLDEKLDYYIATHDMDFNRPSVKGLKYEEIENLLSDIPARRKLLMIDACHSGEVDKDEDAVTPDQVNDSTTLKVNETAKGIKPKVRLGQQNSFELMKELFTDISRGNGAIVISAAAGKEFALENSTWSNGVFTFSLKKALLENLADLNGDGITVNELKNFVSDQVEKYTDGRQRPTTRKENLDYDWKIW